MSAHTETSLKAYSVLEVCENTGGIVFARSSAEARRRGSCEFGDGDFNWGRARRVPWADGYAPGPVPFKVLFDHGWYVDCAGCGRRIQEGQCDDDGNEIDFKIVEVGATAYCTPECLDHARAEKAEADRISEFTVGYLTDLVMRTMPGAVLTGRTHVYVPRGYGPRAPQQASIDFMFPGSRIGPACCRFDKIGERPSFHVCNGDRVAFARWRSLGYPPAMMDSQVEDI